MAHTTKLKYAHILRVYNEYTVCQSVMLSTTTPHRFSQTIVFTFKAISTQVECFGKYYESAMLLLLYYNRHT